MNGNCELFLYNRNFCLLIWKQDEQINWKVHVNKNPVRIALCIAALDYCFCHKSDARWNDTTSHTLIVLFHTFIRTPLSSIIVLPLSNRQQVNLSSRHSVRILSSHHIHASLQFPHTQYSMHSDNALCACAFLPYNTVIFMSSANLFGHTVIALIVCVIKTTQIC